MDKYGTREVSLALGKLKTQLSRKYNIDKMLLFGSRARGDWLYNSDVDLLVISKDFEGEKYVNRSADILAYWDEAIDLEVICYTPHEFEKKKNQIGIVSQAAKEGIAL